MNELMAIQENSRLPPPAASTKRLFSSARIGRRSNPTPVSGHLQLFDGSFFPLLQKSSYDPDAALLGVGVERQSRKDQVS
jgi:hypothetical protein